MSEHASSDPPPEEEILTPTQFYTPRGDEHPTELNTPQADESTIHLSLAPEESSTASPRPRPRPGFAGPCPDAAVPRVIWRARRYTRFPTAFEQDTTIWDQDIDTCFLELSSARHIACRIYFATANDSVVVENMGRVSIFLMQDNHPKCSDLTIKQSLLVAADRFVLHVVHDTKIAVAIAFVILPRIFEKTVSRLPIRRVGAQNPAPSSLQPLKRRLEDSGPSERPAKRGAGRQVDDAPPELAIQPLLPPSSALTPAGPLLLYVVNPHHSHALSEECCYTLTPVKSFRRDHSVFLGKHSGLSPGLVMVKSYSRPSASPHSDVGRWLNEYRAYRALGHPHSKPFLPNLLGADARVLNLYLEFLDMPDLERMRYKKTSMFRSQQSASPHRILSDVANALAYAHGRGVVHNDLKPSNILFDRHRGAVVCDWGLSTVGKVPGGGKDGLGSSTTLCGTPWYIPPEATVGQRLEPPRDIFALGVTALWLLSRIPLPESMGRYMFNVGRLGLSGAESRTRSEWQQFLVAAVNEMECVGLHERLTKEMLMPAPHLRPTASQVKLQLQAFSSARSLDE